MRPAALATGAGLLAAATVPAGASESVLAGTWARGDGGAVVRIARCGEVWCATNVWVAPDRRGREAVGDVLEMRVAPKGDRRLEGTAWDRRRSLSYAMRIDVGADRLATRGCLLAGLLCIDMDFLRRAGASPVP